VSWWKRLLRTLEAAEQRMMHWPPGKRGHVERFRDGPSPECPQAFGRTWKKLYIDSGIAVSGELHSS
jgi:hypothetical protein